MLTVVHPALPVHRDTGTVTVQAAAGHGRKDKQAAVGRGTVTTENTPVEERPSPLGTPNSTELTTSIQTGGLGSESSSLQFPVVSVSISLALKFKLNDRGVAWDTTIDPPF
jgi:hypothetical protein